MDSLNEIETSMIKRWWYIFSTLVFQYENNIVIATRKYYWVWWQDILTRQVFHYKNEMMLPWQGIPIWQDLKLGGI